MSKRLSGEIEGGLKKFKPNSIIARPPLNHLDPSKDSLIFQELEIDHYISDVYPGMPGPQNGPVPVIRMFGVTKDGHSVCCHVHGFSPYLYVSVPVSFASNDLAPFKEQLNNALIADIRDGNKDGITDPVLMVEITKGNCIAKYKGHEDELFVRITLSQYEFISAARRLIPQQAIYKPFPSFIFEFVECNADIKTGFALDNEIFGCLWIELLPEKWFLRTSDSNHAKVSRCQIECDVSYKDFNAHAPEGEWGDVAQFTFHSFDIECASISGYYSEPKIDQVVQIANVVQLYGVNEVKIRNIFCFGSCAPIDNAEVYCYETEREMLEAWASFVRELDPDIFTGYNINCFDFPYLLKRAKILDIANFDLLGRLINVRSHLKQNAVQARPGMGLMRDYKTVNFEGRVAYDMFLVIKRDFKLKSYKLDSVCQDILGEQMEDVYSSIINTVFIADDQTRKRLAVCGLKKAELPIRFINKGMNFQKDLKLARSRGVLVTRSITETLLKAFLE